MSLDLLRYQAIFSEAMEVHISDVNQQAAIMALAAHDPKKMQDVLPKPRVTETESVGGRRGIDDFINKVGSF